MKALPRILMGLAVGLAIGVFLHYVLFRISVSGEPFIYFAF
jgi:hypothetical protein